MTWKECIYVKCSGKVDNIVHYTSTKRDSLSLTLSPEDHQKPQPYIKLETKTTMYITIIILILVSINKFITFKTKNTMDKNVLHSHGSQNFRVSLLP